MRSQVIRSLRRADSPGWIKRRNPHVTSILIRFLIVLENLISAMEMKLQLMLLQTSH